MAVVFEELYARMREQVLRLAFRITADSGCAEDVVQDTFLQVHSALSRFRGDSSPDTWVYRIAIRTASRHARRRARAPQTQDELPELHAAEVNEFDQKEANATLQAAIHSLPEELRRVIALLSLEELSASAVAEILGVPEGTVWSRSHKARKLLRERLQDH